MTPTSVLLPVLWGDVPAMLKVAVLDEEKLGNQLMVWWNGGGAARVLKHAEGVILMERAETGISLADLVREGRDDEASRIICMILRRLHVQRVYPPPALPPLITWFEPLGRVAEAQGGILRAAAETASHLLSTQHDVVVLHGDMHHGNVLRFRSRGWLAIDPKGLIGEPGFDYANMFCNPDDQMATMPGRLAREVKVVAEAADLESNRLLSWILAWAGLSAAFSLEDHQPCATALKIAELAAGELNT